MIEVLRLSRRQFGEALVLIAGGLLFDGQPVEFKRPETNLKIVVIKPATLMSNGTVEYQVCWQVPPGLNGFVVQHVIFETAPPESGLRGYEFWEAWEVSDNKIWVGSSHGGRGIEGGTDTLRVPAQGNWKISAWAKFIPKLEIKLYRDGWTPGIHNDHHSNAGPLLFSTQPPQDWTDAGALRHSLETRVISTGENYTISYLTTP